MISGASCMERRLSTPDRDREGRNFGWALCLYRALIVIFFVKTNLKALFWRTNWPNVNFRARSVPVIEMTRTAVFFYIVGCLHCISIASVLCGFLWLFHVESCVHRDFRLKGSFCYDQLSRRKCRVFSSCFRWPYTLHTFKLRSPQSNCVLVHILHTKTITPIRSIFSIKRLFFTHPNCRFVYSSNIYSYSFNIKSFSMTKKELFRSWKSKTQIGCFVCYK